MNKSHFFRSPILGFIAVTLAALTAFRATAADGPPPKGWGGTVMNQYKRGTDPEVQHDGSPSVFIEAQKGSSAEFGTMTQSFSAADYTGKRVQYKGFIKTKDVTGTGAGLWLRADDERMTLQMDNMEKRSLKGTIDWTEVSIVFDVPETAKSFMMGVILAGKGRMWVSGLSFGVVDKSVAVTAPYKEGDFKAHLEEKKSPRNLSFTE